MSDEWENRPFSRKEREVIDMLTEALKRAAARWKPSPVVVEDDE